MKRLHSLFWPPAVMVLSILANWGSPRTSHGEDVDHGYLFVTSWNDSSIYGYDAATGDFVGQFVTRRSGGLVQPWSCIFSPFDGNLLVAGNHFVPGQFIGILRYDGATGEFIDQFTPKLAEPHGVTFGPDGNVYLGMRIAEDVGVVARIDGLTGEYLDDFVLPGDGGLGHPTSHVFGPRGGNPNQFDLYVATGDLQKVLRFDGTTGELIGDFVAAGSGGLEFPIGMVFGPDGNLYVADDGANPAVLRFQGPNGRSPGAFMDVFVPPGSGGLLDTFGLLFGPDANADGEQDLYVNSQIIRPNSFITVKETSSVKVYDGVTGDYIRDFVSIKNNGGLDGPGLMTFTLTHPMTLEYLGD